MFSKIIDRYPNAHLDVFCDMDNEWANSTSPEEMKQIRIMLNDYKDNITNHGWVNSNTLKSYWGQAEYWLYPCIFKETCCLTAMEAAASKTLCICPDLAALNDIVGDRGIIIHGDVSNDIWQEDTLKTLFEIMDGHLDVSNLIQRNYEWAEKKSYSIVVTDFVIRFVEPFRDYII